MTNVELLYLICFGVGFIGLAMMISQSKKSPKNVRKFLSSPKRVSATFMSNIDKISALKAIVNFATKNGFKVDYINESECTIIISESMGWSSSGGLYPIQIDDTGNGKVNVKVGVIVKAMLQTSFQQKRKLDEVVNRIKAELFSNQT